MFISTAEGIIMNDSVIIWKYKQKLAFYCRPLDLRIFSHHLQTCFKDFAHNILDFQIVVKSILKSCICFLYVVSQK